MTDLDDFVWEDLDEERARTDPEFDAASAEWLAGYQALRNAQRLSDRMDMYLNVLKHQNILRELVLLGATEYQAKLDANIAHIDRWRATGMLKRAIAPNALAELTDPFRRAEFACIAWRHEKEYWPRRIELQKFMRSRFGIRQAEQILLQAINEPSRDKSGLFFADDELFEKGMEFPQPPNANPDLRCYVTAEAQSTHGLHRIYRAWSYRAVTEGDEE